MLREPRATGGKARGAAAIRPGRTLSARIRKPGEAGSVTLASIALRALPGPCARPEISCIFEPVAKASFRLQPAAKPGGGVLGAKSAQRPLPEAASALLAPA